MNPYRLLLRLVPSRLKNSVSRKLHEVVLDVSREEAFLVSRDVARAEARWIMGELARDIPAEENGDTSIPAAGGDISNVKRRFLYGRLLDRMMGPEPWAIDELEIEGGRVQIRGWALAPANNPGRIGFCLNGAPFDEILYPGERHDIGGLFWFRPTARHSAFSCATRCPPEDPSSPLVFSYVYRDTLAPVCAEHLYYLPWGDDGLPLPDGPRRHRAHGSDSATSFRLEGFSAFCKLDHALLRHTGRTYRDFHSILDWGCGCGRVSRYFVRVPGVRLTGVDIDADNVAWCRGNLRFGAFEAVDPRPPTRFPDEAFDLVIGVSVFTHLREEDQLLWLAELHRLSKPGGILLLTVLGDHGVARGRLTLDEFWEFQERGISEDRRNRDIDGVIADAGYYRNTFHSYRYLRDVWGRHFRFRGVIPSYIGNMQDLLILQRA
ncbi:class I SAM-dependent methyltransferase [Candidatus Fermentibacteria bacterium]|nr:class I SAM-dependent methyltransferase [Candidatus Fermentibacteria bacterium]